MCFCVGLGHFENTQVTVNNQMVVGTLMNICDDPTKVSYYAVEWREEDACRRTPIIVTGKERRAALFFVSQNFSEIVPQFEKVRANKY